MKKGHIFVQCAAYRDPELKPTIKTALENATHPDKVSFGICWQGKMNEINQQLYLAGMKQCRTVFIHMHASKGIGYARQKAQMMHEGEEYVLQIDSHMRFLPGWDTKCIEMLQACPGNKPMLTAYLTDYNGEEPACYRLGATEFDQANGNITITGVKEIKAPKPQLGILASGHFVFVRSKFFVETPIDPYLQFLYEETMIAPRAWTNGWDIYYPHIAPLQHQWDRMGRSLNWDDLDTSEQEQASQDRYQQLVGQMPIAQNFGRYGMGNARTLQAYEEFSGIGFKQRTLTEKAKKGRPNL